ncbi:hypothetical protein C8R46DRAFT_1296669 [Mycena filopes]|nr:hypothetical protein C8R46DRAFT_1296669 [Mycena filopes]
MDEPQHSPPSPTTTIPEEILLAIFRLALPPSWLMDPGIWPPPFPGLVWSSDVLTKLAFLRVCKMWYRIMLELLYENVELRQIGQLVALTRTLEDRPELGVLVRSLKFCYAPNLRYLALHGTEIKTLFALCPGVTDLTTFSIVYNFPIFKLAHVPAITTLDLGDATPFSPIPSVLIALSPTLESLSLPLHPAEADSYPTLTFPRLQYLRFGGAMSSSFPTARWVLPALRLLSFRHNTLRGLLPPDLDLVAALLTTCRPAPLSTLTHLNLAQVFRHVRMTRTPLTDVLALCPALQHLVTTEEQLAGLPGEAPTHTGLRALDIFGSHAGGVLPAPYLADLQCAFPALRAYHIIDGPAAYFSGADLHLRDLPADLKRGELAAPVFVDAARDYCVPTFSWYAALMAHADDDEDDAEDSDFVFEEGDDDGGSATTDSDSDSEDEDEDGRVSGHGGVKGEEEEEGHYPEAIGREEALVIYRRTLELRAARDAL